MEERQELAGEGQIRGSKDSIVLKPQQTTLWLRKTEPE